MSDNKQQIANELEGVVLQLADRSMQAVVTDKTTSQALANDVTAEISGLQLVSEMMDFPSLQVITEWLTGNIIQASEEPEVMATLQSQGHLFQWAELLASMLRQNDASLLTSFNDALQHEHWPTPMSDDELAKVLPALATNDHDQDAIPSFSADQQIDDSNEKYTIQWDADIHPEILNAFLEDTPDQISQSAALIHKISAGSATAEDQKLATRLIHTIKGDSGVVGVTSLVAFTHQLEEILEHSVDNALSADTQELLSASADCLEDMGDAMLNQRSLPAQFSPLLAQLEKVAGQIDEDDDDDEFSDFGSDIEIVDQSKNVIVEASTTEAQTNEKYTIQWDADIHPEILNAFLEDTPDQITQSAALVHKISAGSATAEEHKLATRLIHTIKGDSGVVGVTSLVAFTHQLEEILEHSVDNTLSPDTQELLSASADCLEDMGDSMLNQNPLPAQFSPLLAQLETLAGQIDEDDDDDEFSDFGSDIEMLDQSEDVIVEALATEAQTDEQYTIQWDEDIHPEILNAFLTEAPDQISESAAIIHKVANGTASTEEKKLAARLTHTVKGASGVVGVSSLVAFTHQLEEILEYSVDNTLPSEAQALLPKASDCLASMGEAMVNKQPLPTEFSSLLSQLEAVAQQLDTDDEDIDDIDLDATHFDDDVKQATPLDVPNDIQSNVTDTPLESSQVEEPTPLQELLTSTNKAPTQTLQEVPQTRTNEQTMRVPISLIDDLLNLAEELITSTSQVNDNVKDMLLQSQQMKTGAEKVSNNMAELEKAINLQLTQVQKQGEETSAFDELDLEVYNELHSSYGLLNETIADSREIERAIQQNLRQLNDKLHTHQRINREINTTVLNTRMESLSSLTPRLERIVRETCRSTGKKATLEITGSNLAVDTDILKGLTDPLLHLLRNSVDHGIETVETRQEKTKDISGKIALSFEQEGRYIMMTLADDGAGIDPEAIYQRALSRGLIGKDEVFSEKEKLELILLAGFSTRDTVSNISGRGVGMDVVRDAVSNLRGTLSIASTPNKGTSINIRLPLTLVAANTIMVKVARQIVAIPVDSMERLHTINAGALIADNNAFSTQIDDKKYDVQQLSALLGWGNPKPELNQEYPAILVTDRQKHYALIVDTVLEPREVVVKSLAPWLSNVSGLNGACLLNDGAVSAVLDLPRLLEKLSEVGDATYEAEKELVPEDSLVLIVDDSLSNRKALSITTQQLGYRTITAIDGQDALEQVKEQAPDLILSDLEMPRMNGLEFAQEIRNDKSLEHIPFIMITSRATNKHRKQAKLAGASDYLVKPVDRETLQNRLEKWLK